MVLVWICGKKSVNVQPVYAQPSNPITFIWGICCLKSYCGFILFNHWAFLWLPKCVFRACFLFYFNQYITPPVLSIVALFFSLIHCSFVFHREARPGYLHAPFSSVAYEGRPNMFRVLWLRAVTKVEQLDILTLRLRGEHGSTISSRLIVDFLSSLCAGWWFM